MTYHYLNLTNGLEYLLDLLTQDVQVSFLRITSTAIEKGDWYGLFMDLDHNLLARLAAGHRCIVYDCGCQRETSKVVAVGVPVIRECLEKYWLGRDISGDRASEVYRKVFHYSGNAEHAARIHRKLGYYRKILCAERVALAGVSSPTANDGNWGYFRGILAQARG